MEDCYEESDKFSLGVAEVRRVNYLKELANVFEEFLGEDIEISLDKDLFLVILKKKNESTVLKLNINFAEMIKETKTKVSLNK